MTPPRSVFHFHCCCFSCLRSASAFFTFASSCQLLSCSSRFATCSMSNEAVKLERPQLHGVTDAHSWLPQSKADPTQHTHIYIQAFPLPRNLMQCNAIHTHARARTCSFSRLARMAL